MPLQYTGLQCCFWFRAHTIPCAFNLQTPLLMATSLNLYQYVPDYFDTHRCIGVYVHAQRAFIFTTAAESAIQMSSHQHRNNQERDLYAGHGDMLIRKKHTREYIFS